MFGAPVMGIPDLPGMGKVIGPALVPTFLTRHYVRSRPRILGVVQQFHAIVDADYNNGSMGKGHWVSLQGHHVRTGISSRSRWRDFSRRG